MPSLLRWTLLAVAAGLLAEASELAEEQREGAVDVEAECGAGAAGCAPTSAAEEDVLSAIQAKTIRRAPAGRAVLQDTPESTFRLSWKTYPDKCWDVQVNDDGGRVLVINDCDATDDTFTLRPSGTGLIKWTQDPQYCLDSPGGTQLQLWKCNAPGTNEENYQFTVTAEEQIYVESTHKCIDVPNEDMTNGNQLQVWSCDDMRHDELFKLVDVDPVYFYIKSAASDSECMDWCYDNSQWQCASTLNIPDNVYMRTCKSSAADNQRWYQDGQRRIVSQRDSSMCLTYGEYKYADKWDIYLAACTDDAKQKWSIDHTELDGAEVLTVKSDVLTGDCIMWNTQGSLGINNVIMTGCSGHDDQAWRAMY